MKPNVSLRSFSNVILGLTMLGILGVFIAFVTFYVQLNDYSPDLGALYVAAAFGYVGGGLIGLAIFGAFLRITAKAIIEGLGGNIETAEEDESSSLTHAELVDGLTEEELLAWEKAGKPNLAPWGRLGKPNFFKYLEDEE